MVPFAHGNDLGGSLRYPASACGLFALKPTRARNPLGPEYGDVAQAGAVEHALTRSVRDSAASSTRRAGPRSVTPTRAPPPARPFLEEVGIEPRPLRIAFTARTPDGDLGHPDCVAGGRARGAALRVARSSGHRVRVARLHARGRRCDRHDHPAAQSPGSSLLDPPRRAASPNRARSNPSRVAWEAGNGRDSRRLAHAIEERSASAAAFPGSSPTLDLFLTPTMSAPRSPSARWSRPADDPWRAMKVSAPTDRYAGVVANLTAPRHVGAAYWNGDGYADRCALSWSFGDEATLFRLAAQLEELQPWRAACRPFTRPGDLLSAERSSILSAIGDTGQPGHRRPGR